MRKLFESFLVKIRVYKVYCPCCESYSDKFLPFGLGPRENARCGRCGSLERHRMLWLYFKQYTNFFTEHIRLLHFAPEYTFQTRIKKLPNVDYVTADLCSDRADHNFDIQDIPFNDNSYDVVLCLHVLEHVDDDHKAMTEILRVLKPGGWAIILVPILREVTYEDSNIKSAEQRRFLFGQEDHVRMYGKDFDKRLKRAGFDVKVDDYTKRLDTKTIDKYRLRRYEDIYFCTKPI